MIILLAVLLPKSTMAQNNLDKMVTMQAKGIKLSNLLSMLGDKGKFYFSYSNEQIRADSIVNVSATHQTIRTLLDELFNGNIDYKESPGYIILRPAPNRLTLLPDTSSDKESNYYISGYVIDDRSGLGIPNASVYEKRMLVSTLTDHKGFFKIKVKSDGQITITVSKEFYKDASVNFLSNVTISPKKYNSYYANDTASGNAEKSWLGRIFISSKQRIQSLNLGGFMASVPFQTSFTPGLSTHGMMSSQVVNHYSINLLGGYTAGLDGIEMGGLFNLSKEDVRYLQMAGLFNVVGGNFEGVQLAGLGNTVSKKVKGLQMAGLYNMVKDTLKGVQIAGIANIGKEVTGFQMAGIYNKSLILKGAALGLVNITDTLEGYAFGLVNISKNGYRQIQLYNDELTTANVAFKSGNAKLYATLSFGANLTDATKLYSFGLGIGHDFVFNRRTMLSAELSVQSLQSGNWKDQRQVNRFSTLLNVKTGAKFGIFGGPSFNLMHQDEKWRAGNEQITKNKIGLMDLGNNNAGWIGWRIGVFY